MLSITDYKYYQPQYPDGSLPEGLFSFQVFNSEQEAIDWMEEHLDLDEDNCEKIEIREYCNDDIEGVTVIDHNGDILPKIEEMSTEEITDYITDEILLNEGSIDNMIATKQSDETYQEFEDRVYTEALDLVNSTIEEIEEANEFDFSAYGGNPEVDWYDEARDEAVKRVIAWMHGEDE